MRYPHIIQPNRKNFFPYHFIFFDTETTARALSEDKVEHIFRLGVACWWCPKNSRGNENTEWIEFTSPKTLFDFIEKKAYSNKTLYVIAHNIDFDFKVVGGFAEMRKRGYELSLFINNAIVRIWRYKKQKKRIVFLDNLNFFSLPLKQLGEDIGLKKLEMPSFSDTKDLWFKYCRRDVEILLELWKVYLKFLKDNDLGSFAPTIASQAMNAYRHRFMTHKIYIHNNQKVIDLERESYHGARVECFFVGKAPKREYFQLDVNSMYPYLMLKEKYPVKFIDFTRKGSLFYLKKVLDKFSAIARVKVKTPIPIFAKKIENRLCFPTGTFYTTLTTNELKYALKHNFIKNIYEMSVYEKASIFRDYVNFFYFKRLFYKKTGNLSYSFLCKLFMNSLYGKFGQKNDVWEDVYISGDLENGYYEEWDADQQRLRKFRIVEGKVQEAKGEVEAYNSFPAIASEVTANGRLYLWHFIQKAGVKNVFYCDTDSLIVNINGLVRLKEYIDKSRLGYLKVENISDDLEIFAPKYYRLGQKLRMKGISKKATQIDPFHFEDWQFLSVKGALRRDDINRQVMVKVKKSLKREYTKGRVLKSGRVIPFKLNEK